MPSPSPPRSTLLNSQAKNSDMHIDTISIMNSWKHKLPLQNLLTPKTNQSASLVFTLSILGRLLVFLLSLQYFAFAPRVQLQIHHTRQECVYNFTLVLHSCVVFHVLISVAFCFLNLKIIYKIKIIKRRKPCLAILHQIIIRA